MLEKALVGGKKYWGWLFFLLLVLLVGAANYLRQLDYGLGITGMSRDVTWALYIAQFTFLVGVAASAVMLVLPYYLHNYKAFGRITILGEFLAVASVVMCLTFIIVDLGQPARAFNVILYPTPSSILFWDMIVLNGYLLLNILIGWTVLDSERKGIAPPKWVKILIYVSIPWAISIHTVTAFIYAGLPGRSFWLTAIMAPRFLASAFASGPALSDSSLFHSAKIHPLRRRQRAHSDPGEDRDLRRDHQHLFRAHGDLHGLLQPDPGAHEAFHLSLRRSGRSPRACPLDVGLRHPGVRGGRSPDQPEDAEKRGALGPGLRRRIRFPVDRKGPGLGGDGFHSFAPG